MTNYGAQDVTRDGIARYLNQLYDISLEAALELVNYAETVERAIRLGGRNFYPGEHIAETEELTARPPTVVLTSEDIDEIYGLVIGSRMEIAEIEVTVDIGLRVRVNDDENWSRPFGHLL